MRRVLTGNGTDCHDRRRPGNRAGLSGTAEAGTAPVACEARDIGVQRYDGGGRAFIHLLSYRYDKAEDRVLPARTLRLTARNLPGSVPQVFVPGSAEAPVCRVHTEGDESVITVENAGLYTILAF